MKNYFEISLAKNNNVKLTPKPMTILINGRGIKEHIIQMINVVSPHKKLDLPSISAHFAITDIAAIKTTIENICSSLCLKNLLICICAKINIKAIRLLYKV